MVKHWDHGDKSALSKSINIGIIAKAIIISYLVTIPTFAIFAFILANTSFPEKYIAPAVVITSVISILIAGSTATRGTKSKGWLNGAIVGFIYFFILYIISSICYSNFSIDKYVATMTVIGILAGSIGGIIGINLKTYSHVKPKRKRA